MKHRFAAKLMSIFLCLSILTGCGTLTHGTSQTLLLKSTPSGARAKVSNGYETTTPDSVIFNMMPAVSLVDEIRIEISSIIVSL